MRIAVVGAGFCGLAVAWNLSNNPSNEITIFDAAGIGKGASGIAAGLLHGYVGAHSKLNWRAAEGMQATQELLSVAERAIGFPVVSASGMLRPALSDDQLADFETCVNKNSSDVSWRMAAECQQDISRLNSQPGIFVKSAMVVDCENYLKGMWQACSSHGVKLELQTITHLNQLQDYDKIIMTIGASTNTLAELAHVPLTLIKGQVLQLKWPVGRPLLPYPINSSAYLLNNRDGTTCTAGATFERHFSHTNPDAGYAMEEILPKINAFLPLFDSTSLIACRAGVRAISKQRRPLIMQINEKCWILTGMGAKGLLYHALMAKELVALI